MANTNTQFSFYADLPPHAISWAMTLHTRLEQCLGFTSDVEEDVVEDAKKGNETAQIACDLLSHFDDWIGFSLEVQYKRNADDCGLWIYAEEDGDPDHVILFLQAVLRRFNLPNVLSFTWACTCDKPRIDQFFGGGVCFTKDRVDYADSLRWSAMTASKMEEETNDPLLSAAKNLLDLLDGNNVKNLPPMAMDDLRKIVAQKDREKIERDYVANLGINCPSCGNTDDISGHAWNVESGTATQEVYCHNCHATWLDVYTLSGFDKFEPGIFPDPTAGLYLEVDPKSIYLLTYDKDRVASAESRQFMKICRSHSNKPFLNLITATIYDDPSCTFGSIVGKGANVTEAIADAVRNSNGKYQKYSVAQVRVIEEQLLKISNDCCGSKDTEDSCN